jgi:hypothetical protein
VTQAAAVGHPPFPLCPPQRSSSLHPGTGQPRTLSTDHDFPIPLRILHLQSKYCAGVFKPQSTYIYRVPQCMSPRRNWDSPTPSLASECAPPPQAKGGRAHSPAGEGWGSPNSDDWRKSLSLCLLCVLNNLRGL